MIEFTELGLTTPDGSIIGVIEEGTQSNLAARAAIGCVGPGMPMPDPPASVVHGGLLSSLDAIAKARTVSRLVQLRRAGATFVLLTHDEPLLESCADEIWWLRDGKLIARGDPHEVLAEYRRYVAHALRETGRSKESPIAPVLRAAEHNCLPPPIN